jgi:hypothetical protein
MVQQTSTQQQKKCWTRCSLCGAYRGYIRRASCHWKRVLRRQLEEEELVVRQPPGSKDVNTEAEESAALGAVNRRRMVKKQQAEKT